MKKTSIEELFGGKTRFVILKALAGTKQPMTAYQIAMSKGLDPAATYRYLKEFSELGIAKPRKKGRKQISYTLSDGAGKAAVVFLRSLKQKAMEPIDFEEWMSPEIQAERMANMVRLDQIDSMQIEKPLGVKEIAELMSRRVEGELSALATSSQIAFAESFEQKDGVFILK